VARLRDLDVERYLADPALRQSYVTPMFDLVAPSYDVFTRVFSFGMDQRWKRTLVAIARDSVARDGVVFDVATGTGDLAYALSAARPDLRITGVDVSTEMLSRATRGEGVTLAAGDLSAMPIPDGSLDAVTAGYALRNTPDWRVALQELARVIKPGGQLLTLDFFIPESSLWRSLFLGWLHVAGRAAGWWWHREPMAYGYIAHSINHFTTVRQFADAMREVGFDVTTTVRRLGGGIAIHRAVRR
jgi:demethylmenaquinone methyltransferase / 2-methoxy-6-polyprenyl-1,4-benzoquinol methylase